MLIWTAVFSLQAILSCIGWMVYNVTDTEEFTNAAEHAFDRAFGVCKPAVGREGFLEFLFIVIPLLILMMVSVFGLMWAGGEFFMVYGLWNRHKRGQQLAIE